MIFCINWLSRELVPLLTHSLILHNKNWEQPEGGMFPTRALLSLAPGVGGSRIRIPPLPPPSPNQQTTYFTAIDLPATVETIALLAINKTWTTWSDFLALDWAKQTVQTDLSHGRLKSSWLVGGGWLTGIPNLWRPCQFRNIFLPACLLYYCIP